LKAINIIYNINKNYSRPPEAKLCAQICLNVLDASEASMKMRGVGGLGAEAPYKIF